MLHLKCPVLHSTKGSINIEQDVIIPEYETLQPHTAGGIADIVVQNQYPSKTSTKYSNKTNMDFQI